jgi:recombination protein RecR
LNTLDQLVKSLSKFPGIGSKSARRMAHYLLKTDALWVQDLAAQIARLQASVKYCTICGNYTDESPCPICADPSRDRSVICVVEQPEDINTIEATGDFKGLYHVLKGVISPIDGVGPDDLTINSLFGRLKSGEAVELIIATNPTVEGETTALYLVNLLKKSGIKISQLASGLPAGGDLEYADRLTISRSLKGRRTLLKAQENLRVIGTPNREKPLF